MSIPRIGLANFPDVVMLTTESSVKTNHDYAPAKAGDIAAAMRLVDAFKPHEYAHVISQITELMGTGDYIIVPIHALEADGVNEIPVAYAKN
jgi:hypothetical protein